MNRSATPTFLPTSSTAGMYTVVSVPSRGTPFRNQCILLHSKEANDCLVPGNFAMCAASGTFSFRQHSAKTETKANSNALQHRSSSARTKRASNDAFQPSVCCCCMLLLLLLLRLLLLLLLSLCHPGTDQVFDLGPSWVKLERSRQIWITA